LKLRAAALAAWLALALVSIPGSARAQIDDDLDVEKQVRRVTFQGNQNYEEKKLRELIRTNQKSFWKPWKKAPLRNDFLRADRVTLASFYVRQGFLYARVESVAVTPVGKSGEESDVCFFIHEGPRAVIRSIAFQGVGPIPEHELRETLRYRRGSPVVVSTLAASRDSLVNVYGEQGYVLARISDSLRVDSSNVDVEYRIHAGPQVKLAAVKVEGTKKTKPGYVSREILPESGDILVRSKLIQSQRRIYDSGLYSDVQMSIEPTDSSGQHADLVISVREPKMGWVDAGIGYGTLNQLRLTGQWGQRNIFRSGRRFAASGLVGVKFQDDPLGTTLGDRRIDVTLSQPWFFGVRVHTSLGAYVEDQPKFVEENDFAPIKAYGGSVIFATAFFEQVRSQFSYEFRHASSDSEAVVADVDQYTTNRIAMVNEHDTRTDIFNPAQGHDYGGRIEFVRGASAGTSDFTNLGVQALHYAPVGHWATLALRFRAGYIEPDGAPPPEDPANPSAVPPELAGIPVDDRYRTGGASTVRGYRENALGTQTVFDSLGVATADVRGGQVLLLANAELRVPLLWIFAAGAFFDAGNVWERPEDIKPSKIFSFADGAGYEDMRYSVGLGFRIGTPIGPVRFDYGWKLRVARSDQPDQGSGRGEFHFSLGHAY
jgi:outer membrane protein assembly complex protein YaeT